MLDISTMKGKFLLIASIFILTFAGSLIAQAQWLELNESSGGTIAGMAIVVSGNDVFIGGGAGEVDYSTDNGTTWTKTNVGFNTTVHCMAMDGKNLLVGTERGVFISSDKGVNWTYDSTGMGVVFVNSLAVYDPDGIGDTIIAGAQPSTNESDFLYRSTDGGLSWSADSAGLYKVGVGPYNSIRSIAVVWPNIFAGTYNGGVLSTDGGTTWRPVSSGLPDSSTIGQLAVMGPNLYAAISYSNYTKFALCVSTNNGETWRMALDSVFGEPVFHIGEIAIHGSDMFIGNNHYIYLSTDTGLSWTIVDSNISSYPLYSIAVNDSFIFAGYDGTWNYRRPLSQVISVADVGMPSSTEHSVSTFPNPLSSSTTISFSLTESGVTEVSVVNILGTEVARIFSGELSAGEHSFSWDASGMPPGMYECIVRMNGRVERVAMVVTR